MTEDFGQAGVRVLVAAEKNEAAGQTLKRNNPSLHHGSDATSTAPGHFVSSMVWYHDR